jgi:hypothetical protein
MNNLAKFIITALIIIVAALAYNSYKNGGLDIKSEKSTQNIGIDLPK